MLISEAMTAALNRQIGNEYQTSMQYTAIAAWFASETLPELAKRFAVQADEERDHASKIIDYVVDAGGKIEIPGLDAPKCAFASAEEAVHLALESEYEVTRQINALMDLAIGESDHQAQNFLQWFVGEQREEVALMDTLLKMIRRAGESGLLFVEEYLARNGLQAGASGNAPTA
jgi:ferritin